MYLWKFVWENYIWIFYCKKEVIHGMRKASSTDINQPSRKVPLLVPNLDEILIPLEKFLKNQFETVSIEVVDCPGDFWIWILELGLHKSIFKDLTQPPFSFTSKHFGSELNVVDVGGPGNLFPNIRADKVYNLKVIILLNKYSLKKKAFLENLWKLWIHG